MYKYGLNLTKKGKNWVCLCPFHAERTPSFTIDAAFTFYHCFGCGAGGKIYGLNKRIKEQNIINRKKWLENLKNPKPAPKPVRHDWLLDDTDDDLPF